MEVWQNSFCVLNLKKERDLNLCLVVFGLFFKLSFPSSLLLFSKTLFCDGLKKKICLSKKVLWHALLLVQFSCSVVSDSLQPMDRSTPGFPVHSTCRPCSNSCPSSWWCHPTISSSVVPFSSRLQSFPASGSFPMSQFFTAGGQALELQPQHQSFQWTPRTDLL